MGTLIGKKIGPYQISKLLGRGGMGEVYLATDQMLDRFAALKALKPELSADQIFIQRFSQEARTLAQLNHPHVATLYTILREKGQYIMAMEYIDGEPFDEYLAKRKTLPAAELIPLILSVLDGLAHAHDKGIVHRDLKPSNIMFNKSGVVKVMDFGIARANSDDRHTKTGMIIGTLDYMAPELIQGGDATYSSDLYAIGILMYQALSGKLPFSATSEYSMMQAHVQQKPIPLSKVTSAVPNKLIKFIHRLLEKNPNKRFKSTRDAWNYLKQLDETRQSTAPTPAISLPNQLPPILQTLKEKWMYVAFGLSLLLLAGVFFSKNSASVPTVTPTAQLDHDETDDDGYNSEAYSSQINTKADRRMEVEPEIPPMEEVVPTENELEPVQPKISERKSEQKPERTTNRRTNPQKQKAVKKKPQQETYRPSETYQNSVEKKTASRTTVVNPPVRNEIKTTPAQTENKKIEDKIKETSAVEKTEEITRPKTSTSVKINSGQLIVLQILERIHTEMDLKIGRQIQFGLANPIIGKNGGQISSDVTIDARVTSFKPTAKGKKPTLGITIKSITGPSGKKLPLKRSTIYLEGKRGELLNIKSGSQFKVYASYGVTFKK